MNGLVSRFLAGSLVVLACGLIAAGCGDDSGGSSGSSDDSSVQRIDEAVEACRDKAQDIGGTPGAALEAGCTTFGDGVKAALNQGGEAVDEGLARSADACTAAVGQLPQGKAQDALQELCDAIAGLG
jgi:hypothetical protein